MLENLKLSCFLWMVLGIMTCACRKPDQPEPRDSGLPRAVLEIRGIKVEVEVASTPRTTARGLMYRKSMPDDEGMLFVFRKERFLSFYMKNTLIPLSIAFMRDDGTIINIEKMKPRDAYTKYWSKEKSRLALEMNQGWFEKNGVGSGNRVVIPPGVTEEIFQ